MSSITVRPLSEGLIPAAYALVRMDKPSVSIEEWRLEATLRLAEQTRSAGGVLVAQDPAGHVLALLEYCRADGASRGFRVLRLIVPGTTRQQMVQLEVRLMDGARQNGVRFPPDA